MFRQASVMLTLASLLWSSAQAGAEPEYSARAVVSSPRGETMTIATYVGRDRVRSETTRNGRTIVQIRELNGPRVWLLNPAEKTYLEHDTGEQGAGPAAGAPCASVPRDATCRLLGTEEVNGRTADKYEIILQRDGRPWRMLQWFDTQHGFLIRSESPDGTTALSMQGVETVNGRQTERWEIVVTRAGGRPDRATQWYDPELHTTIREQMPGGFTRELTDIVVGAQPAALFEVPGDYRRMETAAHGNRQPAGASAN